MFGKLFGKKKAPAPSPKSNDPMDVVRIAAKQVDVLLQTALKTEKGVHAQSLMCAVGALAGYACQDAVRALYQSNNVPEEKIFRLLTTETGLHYLFGDDLDKPLMYDKLSVWSLLGGMAQHNGCTELPDPKEMLSYASGLFGDKQYGAALRVDAQHQPHENPIMYLLHFWSKAHAIVKEHCHNPIAWPLVYASLGQELMTQYASVVDPKTALILMMESAVFTSKAVIKNANANLPSVTLKDIAPVGGQKVSPHIDLAKVVSQSSDKETQFALKTIVAGKNVYANLLAQLNSEKGVHIESLMCTIGALGGYACQEAIREIYAQEESLKGQKPFMEMGLSDGTRLFFGNALNGVLAENEQSFWYALLRGAVENGCKTVPDLNDAFAYVTKVAGTPEYGVVRVPDQHKPANAIIYLEKFWPMFHADLKSFHPNPLQWPLVYAYAATEAIREGIALIDVNIALMLMMESAIFASKVDLKA